MSIADYRLVVTSGPTREWIDPVRFISNPSSGKTGWSIATAGRNRFREVQFISGPVGREYQEVAGAVNVRVETTDEMAAAVEGALDNNTLLIMAAAPADYAPAKKETSKIKKSAADLVLELKPTDDILMRIVPKVAALEKCRLVGFAAETDNVKENALAKLRRKGLDFICANEVYRESRGFGENENSWLVLDSDGATTTMGPAPKEKLAGMLIDFLSERL